MARFCPKCGKSITKGVFCEDCKPHVIDYKISNIKICCVCKKIFSHGSWKRVNNLDGAIIKEIKSKVKQKNAEVNLIGELDELKPGTNHEFKAEVVIDEVVHEIPFVIEVTYCRDCSKKGTEYFEGILQIRNNTPEFDKVINKELGKEEKYNNVANKKVTQPNGIDLYMTKKKRIPKLAQRIVEKIGGLYTLNSQLFTHDHLTSKDVYRLNVLLELPNFNIGDVFYFKKKYIKIEKLSKNINARNLLTKKKVVFTYAEYKKIKEKDSDSIKKFDVKQTTIIRLRPAQEVLHPENYQPVKVLNENSELKEDDKVNIILIDKGAIIV